jgi:hypothetical protein
MGPDDDNLVRSARAGDFYFQIAAGDARDPVLLTFHFVLCIGQFGLDVIRRLRQFLWAVEHVPLANLLSKVRHMKAKLGSQLD